ncbi:MAG TPA: helix-turn-helix domain-containing protein [Negativicutes bacterium]|nr:helix-turn-helix domain-containing protein [Negativicutes bacterium]
MPSQIGAGDFAAVVNGLSAMLGPDYCVALYSSAGENQEQVLAVANGRLAGLTAGSRPTPADQSAIDNILLQHTEYVANYFSRTAAGRRLRSCLMRLAADGKTAGYLAIHYDLTQAEILKDMATRLTDGKPVVELSVAEQKSRLDDLIGEGLRRARQYLGKPLTLASKLEKIQVVERLDQEGFFMLKGSIEALSQEMGNTKYTVYSYLRENRIRIAD